MLLPVLSARNGRSERKRREYRKKVRIFLTCVSELAEFGESAYDVLGAAEKDAENPVKFEKKKRSLLGRLLGRGHEDEVGLSGQDVKATLREGGEGEREM